MELRDGKLGLTRYEVTVKTDQSEGIAAPAIPEEGR